jgi:hypothetical protein
MKLFKLVGFVIAALLLVPFAHADGEPVNMVFTGVTSANDGQYYVSPYTGGLFCDEPLPTAKWHDLRPSSP